jgi:hypothetical protein
VVRERAARFVCIVRSSEAAIVLAKRLKMQIHLRHRLMRHRHEHRIRLRRHPMSFGSAVFDCAFLEVRFCFYESRHFDWKRFSSSFSY